MYQYKIDCTRPTTVYRYSIGSSRCQYFSLVDDRWLGANADQKDVIVPDTLARLLGASV